VPQLSPYISGVALKKSLTEELIDVSQSLFHKNYFGIFHGSISAKIEEDTFLINRIETIFDEVTTESFIELTSKRDYRWKEASIDAEIHANIYKYISSAKYVAYTMPPYTTAHSLDGRNIALRDYFGYRTFEELNVYDPKNFDTWYERAPNEIYRYFKTNDLDVMLIKGYGIYSFHRDLHELVKKIAILENSCRLLHLAREQGSGLRHFPLH